MKTLFLSFNSTINNMLKFSIWALPQGPGFSLQSFLRQKKPQKRISTAIPNAKGYVQQNQFVFINRKPQIHSFIHCESAVYFSFTNLFSCKNSFSFFDKSSSSFFKIFGTKAFSKGFNFRLETIFAFFKVSIHCVDRHTNCYW